MTRPSMIRADTIDLQDHHAPSAQDQSNHRVTEVASIAPLAPHQAETLREVAHETAEEETRSPRVSWNTSANGDLVVGAIGKPDGAANSSSRVRNMDAYRQHEQDALAVAQNGGASSVDEDDLDDTDGEMDDDMMDRISSSPSIEDEDIDFEFVYALHTFVATVEGQANATKGDTMVLLDDSNSYWWLVRVVKDSSIGYLPAEHIETPTERLARLNKHRNIDLSATMLGDQVQKPKGNSFKSIRKKKKLTVAFAEPTYVDYSDFDDYSSEDDDGDELFGSNAEAAQKRKDQANAQRSTDNEITDETAKVEPLKTRQTKESTRTDEANGAEAANGSITSDDEDSRTSDEAADDKLEAPSRSRIGTVRNTDSFFKDESVETKKITLTPNLLRDDSLQPSESGSKDAKARTSLDKMDKELMSDKDKKKSKEKDKKEKEKKPSVIRSFFSRKDKKRTSEDDEESLGKRSMDTASDTRESEDRMTEEPVSPERSVVIQQRQPAKLQKPQARIEPSPSNKSATVTSQRSTVELASYLAESRINNVSTVPPPSMRIVDPETKETQEIPSNQQHQQQLQLQQKQQQQEQHEQQQQQQQQQDNARERSASVAAQRNDKFGSPKVMAPRSASAGPDSRPRKAARAMERMELDDSDDSDDGEALMEQPSGSTNATESTKLTRPVLPGSFPDSFQTVSTVSSDRTITPRQMSQNHFGGRPAESPISSPVSPVNNANPPALVVDTSSPEPRSPEVSPSPELHLIGGGPKSVSSASTGREQTWDDTKLRAFFDESDHIRDLLVVVYDKTDVVPAGSDHPVVGGLFREQNAKLAEITTQLDNMLGDWLARKQRLRGTI